MKPLWEALVDAFPSLSMESPPTSATVNSLPFSNSRVAIYRMVVEIHDGLRRLRAYPLVAANDAEEANLVAGPEQDAMKVAVYVVEGLRAHCAGNTPEGTAPAPVPQTLMLHSGGDLDEEATWLAQVADAFGALNQRRAVAVMRRHRRDEITKMNLNSSHFSDTFLNQHSPPPNYSADWR